VHNVGGMHEVQGAEEAVENGDHMIFSEV